MKYYLNHILTLLLWICSVCVFFQPSRIRLCIAFVFVIITLGHDIFFSTFNGLIYYASAGFFDLFIISILNKVRPVCQTTIYLQRICLASILTNFMGWFMWMMYFDPILYDIAFIFIYSCVIIVLLKKDKQNVGLYNRMDSRVSDVFIDFNPWRIFIQKYKGDR